jgi:glycosyltransferase involved in cell wall biosynthesis
MRGARILGLDVRETSSEVGPDGDYLAALRDAMPADVVAVRFHIPLEFSRILCRAADAVLANSGHEPFGLVGLEAMAAGGVAFTGSTGEDYAISRVNAIVLETAEAREIENYVIYL